MATEKTTGAPIEARFSVEQLRKCGKYGSDIYLLPALEKKKYSHAEAKEAISALKLKTVGAQVDGKGKQVK